MGTLFKAGSEAFKGAAGAGAGGILGAVGSTVGGSSPASVGAGLAPAAATAAPLTAETRGRIGTQAIASMKPNAVLINLGRGPVVEEQALVSALRAGAIRGAVLDVFDREPLEPEHPFWSMDNVLLSPHTADRTATWLDEAMELFLENYRRFAAGQALLNVADKRLGY